LPRIVPEHVEIPFHRLLDVVRVGKVEPLDLEVCQTELSGFLTKRHYLRRHLDGGDDLVPVTGHPDCGAFAQASTGSRDKNGLLSHRRLLLIHGISDEAESDLWL
jgi:hypothetical protein